MLEALARGIAPNEPTLLNVSRLTRLGKGHHAKHPGLARIGPELARSPSDEGSVFFADEPDGLRGILLGEPAQADRALTLDLQGIAADE